MSLGFAAALALPSVGAAQTDRRIQAEVTPPDKATLRELLSSDLDVFCGHGSTLHMLLSPQEAADLEARGCKIDVEIEDVRGGLRGGTFLPQYVSYSEAVTKLNSLEAAYPTLADVSILGTTGQGRSIYALKISDNVAVDEIEPEVLIVGNHHAREVISVILPLAIADSLLTNYGSDSQITEWVDEREIWIVPVCNPDGLVYVETTDLFWRKNRRNNGGGVFGVDLNRNYSYQWGHDNVGSSPSTSSETYRGPSAASEPEIAALQDFVNTRQFVFSISYHSYGNWWLWGTGYKPALSVDQDIFAGYGSQVAALNGYAPGNPASSTIYITNGDMNDWLYSSPSHTPVFGMTPEVGGPSDGFNPPAARIPALVAENIEATWIALENADRPGRLAPPGQPTLNALAPSGTGAYDVTWNAPTTADTQPTSYELVEKTGLTTAVDGVELGAGAFNLGGWTVSTVRKFAGTSSLYSGQADGLNRICLAKDPYRVQSGDNFTFRAWYNTETAWDYLYAVVSTDGGRSFTNLAGTNTTMSDPNGNNADNGITGTSGGTFVAMTFSLAAYVDQDVWLGFRYFTDGGVNNEGVYVDEIFPVNRYASTTTLSSSIPGTSFSVSGKPDGTYTYFVRGRDAEAVSGYWSAPLPVVVQLATEAATISAAPKMTLEANQPNPFSHQTEIRFSVPAKTEHSLVIYDVSGRLVRSLSRGSIPAGQVSVTWDGRGDDGSLTPSGVYFYRLETPLGKLEKRAVLRR